MDKEITCRTIDNKFIKVPASELSFRPSVYGVAIKDNSVLLVPQFDGYDFPGGGVDLGELLTDTLIREVKEETGLDAKMLKILWVQDDFFYHPFKEKPFQTPLIYFLCEITGGEISTDGFDEHEREYAKKAEWVSLDSVSTITFQNPVDSLKLIREAIRVKGQLERNSF